MTWPWVPQRWPHKHAMGPEDTANLQDVVSARRCSCFWWEDPHPHRLPDAPGGEGLSPEISQSESPGGTARAPSKADLCRRGARRVPQAVPHAGGPVGGVPRGCQHPSLETLPFRSVKSESPLFCPQALLSEVLAGGGSPPNRGCPSRPPSTHPVQDADLLLPPPWAGRRPRGLGVQEASTRGAPRSTVSADVRSHPRENACLSADRAGGTSREFRFTG